MTDEGVRLQGPDDVRDADFGWGSWAEVRTLRKLYVLTGENWFPIPKRAFGSPEEEASFLDLANRHVGK